MRTVSRQLIAGQRFQFLGQLRPIEIQRNDGRTAEVGRLLLRGDLGGVNRQAVPAVLQIEPRNIQDRPGALVLLPKLLVRLPPTIRGAGAIDVDEHEPADIDGTLLQIQRGSPCTVGDEEQRRHGKTERSHTFLRKNKHEAHALRNRRSAKYPDAAA